MEAAWIETFYQETDAPKRLELLKQNTENELTQADVFRKNYGSPDMERETDKRCIRRKLMELKCLAEGTSLDFGGQRRKQAVTATQVCRATSSASSSMTLQTGRC